MGQSSILDKWLVDRIIIERQEPTQDQFGGVQTKFVAIEHNIRARIWPVSGRFEYEIAGKTFRANRKMLVPAGTNIAPGDYVRRKKERYSVLAIFDRRSINQAEHIACELVTVDIP